MEIALDSGAEDITTEEDVFEVVTSPDLLLSVQKALETAGISVASAESTMIPNISVKVENKHTEQILKLMDALDDNEDVQQVYSNFDIDED